MNYQLIEFMAADKLPKEYQQFPFNFLYAFFKLCVEEFKLEKKGLISYEKPQYERHEFGDKPKDILILEKQGGKATLKFYSKKLAEPDFKKNYGFDGKNFTCQNLSIVSCDGKNLKLRLSKKTEVELGLDPFKVDIGNSNPFEGTVKFNVWFWKSYKKFIGMEFAHIADN